MKKNYLSSLVKMLYIFIGSVIFFYFVSCSYSFVITTVAVLCILLTISVKKNRGKIYFKFISYAIALISGFIVYTLIIRKDIHNSIYSAVVTLFVIILFVYYIYAIDTEAISNKVDYELLGKQEYDCNRIIRYLEKFPAIGINGAWGTGKTFLTEAIQKQDEVKNNYIFIKLDLMSCDLDEMQIIIISALEQILKRDRIFTFHSQQLKRFVSSIGLLQGLYNMLWDSDVSYSDALHGFQKELQYLDKTVVIVYEDIDRISNPDNIKKIFSISEQLICDKIKIIYQYDYNNLKKLKFDRNYIEKYIPFIVNITPIDFLDILKHMFKVYNVSEDLMTISDFEFLRSPIHSAKWYDFGVFDLYMESNIKASIRQVEQFVQELKEILNSEDIYINNKRIVIAFFVVKHFYYSIYENLEIGVSPIDTIKFEIGENSYSLIELFNKHKVFSNKAQNNVNETVRQILLKDDNPDKIAVLAYLGYNLNIYGYNDEKKSLRAFYNENDKFVAVRNSNENIDRLVWNLLCSGKSEYTDNENAVRDFIDTVLSKPAESQKEAYNAFYHRMVNGDSYKNDNTTIFRIGLNSYFSLFQAFLVSDVGTDNWLKFIDFYFQNSELDSITLDLIANMRYCDITNNRVYIHILSWFNQLNVVGNFNSEISYKLFLMKYLRALSSLSYISTEELSVIDNGNVVEDELISVENALIVLNHKLELLAKNVHVGIVIGDIEVILQFIEKNIRIVSHSEKYKLQEVSPEVSVRSELLNQREFDRLLELKDESNFLFEIEKSYYEGKIGAKEVCELEKNI